MTQPSTSILWIRRDLRLADHDALHDAALHPHMLPVFILPGSLGAASRAWLHRSLLALRAQLQALGSDLVVLQGPEEHVFEELSRTLGPLNVYAQASSDPWVAKTSQKAIEYLNEDHTLCQVGDPWLVHPSIVHTQEGNGYRVFTPFWRMARSRLSPGASLPAPTSLPPLPDNAPSSLPLDQWGLAPTIAWDTHFWDHWEPGEEGAREALTVFVEGALHHYTQGRDRPDQVGTSRMSPHLTWGEISIHELARTSLALTNTSLGKEAEKHLSELGWREFARHLFLAHPNLAHEDFVKTGVQWERVDPNLAHAWQTGQTGIPMVDAGMRELWQTGYMHNRVRMIVADYWCKHLGYDWREGANWFWDTLLDADMANNSIGWQWAAGTGPDAAPYYRIFNPVLQGQKFDPKGHYRHQYLPELKDLSGKALDLPGPHNGYPKAVVEPKLGRARALDAWSRRKT